MIGQILIWGIIGKCANAHNRKVKEEYRRKYPLILSKDIPKTEIKQKAFSEYLNEAIEKIR